MVKDYHILEFLLFVKIMFYLLLFVEHASYQPPRSCMRRMANTLCPTYFVRHFGTTPLLRAGTSKFHDGKDVTETIILDRSKKPKERQDLPVQKPKKVPIDLTGYKVHPRTGQLFKAEVTGLETETGEIIDLIDDVDMKKK
jgi:hypothetical protein